MICPCRKEIIVFLDSDNIEINAMSGSLEKIENVLMHLGYERFKKWLSSFGEVICTFAFAPEDKMRFDSKFFYQQGFIPISCPVLLDRKHIARQEKKDFDLFLKEGKETECNSLYSSPTINTTDKLMIRIALKLLSKMPSITHVCVASGDGDFMPIVKAAKKLGKKVMIMAANYRSASKFLLAQADKSPDGKKMVHFFNPIKEE